MTLNELYSVAEDEDVTVFNFTLDKREALSALGHDGNFYIAIDPHKVVSTADEKTKLAHELGHCATLSFYNVFTPYDIRQRHENRADKWAIKKLVPKDELESAVSKGYTEIWELADIFCVTEEFMKKAVSLYQNGNVCMI